MSISTWLLPIVTLGVGYFLREIVLAIRGAGRTWLKNRAVANDLVFPLVRISDELVGRTYHHIRSDFTADRDRPIGTGAITEYDHLYDLYLWARFWAHTSHIRGNVLAYNLSKTRNGRSLLRFLDCLEANKVSIVPRAYQRAVGDGFADEIGLASGGSYYRFLKSVKQDPFFASSLDGVNEIYRNSHASKQFRHDFVKYLIIIHAMNDYLDPRRKVSSPRTALKNKLGDAARRDLRLRILPQYTPLSADAVATYAG